MKTLNDVVNNIKKGFTAPVNSTLSAVPSYFAGLSQTKSPQGFWNSPVAQKLTDVQNKLRIPAMDVSFNRQPDTAQPFTTPLPLRTKTVFNTPPLYTEGNQIKRKDTGQPITLKGATSDAFRHPEGKYTDPNELIKRIDQLYNSGGNLITFWTTPEGYNARPDLADKVVNYANDKGMYVNFAPLIRPKPINVQSNSSVSNQADIENLMTALAQRYKNKPNVIYGAGAEPKQSWQEWEKPATQIIDKIRSVNPDAVVFVPGGNFGRQIDWPLDKNNVIYGTEDYLAINKDRLKQLQSQPGYQEKYAWQNPDYTKLPLLISEMGGTINSDFGSPEDLSVITRMLNDIEARKYNYQMHSLDTYDTLKRSDNQMFDISGLGMYDKNGNLTAKGKLTLDFLSKHPASKLR